MARKVDIKKLVKRSIIIMLLAGIFGIFLVNKIAQRNGYAGLRDFIENYAKNQTLKEKADPVSLDIQMSSSDYDFIKQRREEALDRGIQINDGDNYVACEITAEGETKEAEIRLKGHMTDHLEGEKWSYRVKSKEKILGMYRFSLQHPGTRNYAYEWVYHQLLKAEGIIYLNYDFVQVNMQDKDLGIYALEEHFGQNVLEHNDRAKGAILRWNPNLYWEWRIDQLDGIYLDEQYSDYNSSFAEPYDKGTVEKDSALIETYLKGASMLEAFRRGDKSTSEVFDLTLMARFHAIIDLVGGQHSLDWSDVKYYYNAETEKVEPVGYESFSVRKTERIAGQRVPDEYNEQVSDFHDRLFADPVFFETYIQELQRICTEEYFNAFISSIKEEHEQKLAILALEWPHRKFTFDPYFENIKLIRNNLELPKPLHAFVERSDDSTVTIAVSPVSDYPIIIENLEIDGKGEFTCGKDVIIPPKGRNTYAKYYYLEFPHKGGKVRNPILKCSIPGGKDVFEIEVLEIPSYKKSNVVSEKIRNSSDGDYVIQQLNDSVLFFNQDEVHIDNFITIAAGYELRIYPGQIIHIEDGGEIGIEGKVVAIGSVEDPIRFITDNNDGALNSSEGDVMIEHAEISGEGVFLNSSFGKAVFNECTFYDQKANLVNAIRSEVSFFNCSSGTVESWGYYENSTVRMKYCTANKGGNLLSSAGSHVRIRECQIKNLDEVLDLNHISEAYVWACNISEVEHFAIVNNASIVTTFGGNIHVNKDGSIVDDKVYSEVKSKVIVRGTKTNFQ